MTRTRFAKVGAMLAALTLLLAGLGTHAAFAATLTVTNFGCSSFTVNGTSGFSGIYQEVDGAGIALASQVTPVMGGSFSATVGFANQAAGTTLTYIAIEEVTPGTIVGGNVLVNSATACAAASPISWGGSGSSPANGPDIGTRLNMDNAAPPFALYCFNGGVAVWTIDHLTGKGTWAFTATPVEIGTALAEATSIGQNVEIDALWGASLWALSSNQLQAHWSGQGDPYDFIFASNTCGAVYAGPSSPVAAPPAAPSWSPSIPPGTGQTTYVVQPGDDLYRISLRFNVSMQAIAAANGITNYNLIFVGEVLVIP